MSSKDNLEPEINNGNEPMEATESESFASPTESQYQQQPCFPSYRTRYQQKAASCNAISLSSSSNSSSNTSVEAVASQQQQQQQQHPHQLKIDHLCRRLQQCRRHQSQSQLHRQSRNSYHNGGSVGGGSSGANRRRSSAISAKSKHCYLSQYKVDKTAYFNGVLVSGRLPNNNFVAASSSSRGCGL